MRLKHPFRRPPAIDISSYWGNLTDPREHNPDNFRYLVHALNTDRRNAAMLRRMAVVSGVGCVAGQAIDLSKKPTRITKAITKSTSLIDQDHDTTWTSAGLLIGIPPEDILITSPVDAGTINGSREHILETMSAEYPKLLEPEEVLEQSTPDIQNEIVVATGNAALIGFFAKVDSLSGHPLDPQMTSRLAGHAQRLRLPLVAIPAYDQM